MSDLIKNRITHTKASWSIAPELECLNGILTIAPPKNYHLTKARAPYFYNGLRFPDKKRLAFRNLVQVPLFASELQSDKVTKTQGYSVYG